MRRSRLIRKYVNRRLYDTAKSRYVNLADLRDLVLGGNDITVIDQPTGSDITSSVLLQIISDMEVIAGRALLTPDFLCELLRTVAHAEPGVSERLKDALLAGLPAGESASYAGESTTHDRSSLARLQAPVSQ